MLFKKLLIRFADYYLALEKCIYAVIEGTQELTGLSKSLLKFGVIRYQQLTT
jgi:hypothetical protein